MKEEEEKYQKSDDGSVQSERINNGKCTYTVFWRKEQEREKKKYAQTLH